MTTESEGVESEVWKSIPGFEGLYEVSDLGRVRSIARVVTRSNGVPNPVRQRILKPSKSKNQPYLNVVLQGRLRNLKKTFYIHSLVTEAFLGPRPERMVTRHLNGNHIDNRLVNLLYGTHQENALDMHKHGTMARAILTHDMVVEARRRFSLGESYRSISQSMDVKYSTIFSAVSGINWKHIKEAEQ